MLRQFKNKNRALAIAREVEKNSECYGTQNKVIIETQLPETIQEGLEESDEMTKTASTHNELRLSRKNSFQDKQ